VVREETFVLLEFLGLAPENSSFIFRFGHTLAVLAIKDFLFLAFQAALDIGGKHGGPLFPRAISLGISILDTGTSQNHIPPVNLTHSPFQQQPQNQQQPPQLSQMIAIIIPAPLEKNNAKLHTAFSKQTCQL
jgi:hypothetical protein